MKRIILASVLLLIIAGCVNVPAKIEDPVINPPSGEYTGKLTITMSSESKSILYYTLDGSNPNDESQIYTGPIEITQSTVVKAISYKPGQFLPSNIISRTYVIS